MSESLSQTFDGYSATYGEAVQDSIRFSGLPHDFFLRAKVERIVAETDRRFGSAPLSALDVGCGVGALHPWLKGRFRPLHGTDLSADCLAEARTLHPDVSYTPCEPGELPYDDDGFDVLTASCVLHHVPLAERAGFAAELRRVLRPGGLLAIVEHNPFNPLTQLSVLRCPFDEDAVLLRARSTERLLRAAGFAEVRSEHFLVFPSEHPRLRGLERGLKALPLGAQYVTFAA